MRHGRFVTTVVVTMALGLSACGANDVTTPEGTADTTSAAALESESPEPTEVDDGTDEAPTGSAAPNQDAPTVEDQAVGALSDQLVALVDEYLRAFNDYDQDAFRAVAADDYRFVLPDTTFSADTTAGLFEDNRRQNWAAEQVSEYTLVGTDPDVVEWDIRFTSDAYGDNPPMGTCTLTVVDDDGSLKVSRHEYEGDPL